MNLHVDGNNVSQSMLKILARPAIWKLVEPDFFEQLAGPAIWKSWSSQLFEQLVEPAI